MSWATGSWGYSGWGGVEAPGVGNSPPVVIDPSPEPNSFNQPDNAVVSFTVFDPDYNLAPATVTVVINGVTVYTGGTFTAGYTGDTINSAGALIVQIQKIRGWGFNQSVTVLVTAADTLGASVTAGWTWGTQENPVCYSGLTPLAVELLIQSPMEKFLDLEPLRAQLFSSVLRAKSTNNALNKASRVIYQLAFETEINTVLNRYQVRDDKALSVVVCERAGTLSIDSGLSTLVDRTRQGLQNLFSVGGVPIEYINSFVDYLDSTQYSYRVSLQAAIVLLARLIETTEQAAGGINISGPLILGG